MATDIPVQITVPLWETLVTEMRKARDRNLPYEFGHYIMICKLYKTKADNNQDHQVGSAHVLCNAGAPSVLCLNEANSLK